MPQRVIPIHQRMWPRVHVTDGCWLWVGGVDTYGYGQIGLKQKKYKTHRMSWRFFHGPIPRGLSVLHRCDTPACVNPDHLFLGTQLDNRADCVSKGRHVVPDAPVMRGEDNPHAVLTDEDCRQILDLLRAGYTQYQVADLYEVTQSTISRIKRGVRCVPARAA